MRKSQKRERGDEDGDDEEEGRTLGERVLLERVEDRVERVLALVRGVVRRLDGRRVGEGGLSHRERLRDRERGTFEEKVSRRFRGGRGSRPEQARGRRTRRGRTVETTERAAPSTPRRDEGEGGVDDDDETGCWTSSCG